ncbi:MAG TPA: TIR domain-containing protein [Longimicrobium sp.]|nr:TIR domain-containing protein [Longimicrobium sp.]
MARRVFISYKFTDREVAHTVHNFFQYQSGKCDGEAVFVTEDVGSEGETAIKAEIKRVMETCHIVLFVVGDNSHNSPWINYEAQLARNWKKPMLAVQASGTNGGVPNEIADQVDEVEWSQSTLCSALNALKP